MLRCTTHEMTGNVLFFGLPAELMYGSFRMFSCHYFLFFFFFFFLNLVSFALHLKSSLLLSYYFLMSLYFCLFGFLFINAVYP